MKYIIITLIFSIISSTKASCPTVCNCTESTISCIEKNIEYIPDFDMLDSAFQPLIIDLSGNKLNYIINDDFSFDNNYYIKELYLNNSEIADIDDDSFEELDNLQELYLQNNLLNSVSQSIIEPLENMVLLDLSKNYFTSGMPVIKSKSLEVLGLANSKISSVPEDALKYLPNLKMLLLQQNNLKSIDVDVFKYVPNNIILMVKLSYNSWECNCKNVELFNYLSDKQYVDTSESYQCIDSNDTFINIYEHNKISEQLQSKCYENNFEQPENDIEDENIISDIEKPYSLVKMDNESYSEEDDIDSEVSIEDISENEAQISLINFLNEWIGVISLICCFLTGFLVGWYVHTFLVAARLRNLETAGSRAKLISSDDMIEKHPYQMNI